MGVVERLPPLAAERPRLVPDRQAARLGVADAAECESAPADCEEFTLGALLLGLGLGEEGLVEITA